VKSLLDNAVKIRFVKNLDVVGYEVVCMWWVGEIHVDEKLRDSPHLEEIVKSGIPEEMGLVKEGGLP